jgi:hypothetical protein
MRSRPLAVSLALMFATAVMGLVLRFASLGLPPAIVKYGGSTMWALVIYWVASSLLPAWRLPAAALLAGLIATAVEFGKLHRSPWLDEFRLTLPGILLLGKYFSYRNILAYWLAIVFGVLADRKLRPAADDLRS